ncbi:MAG: hypothetical protein D6753_08740 [Planctomycetota bacterium]|nr:MAG: hypothetical protein D6753_08740 [Planctomycetota bacterium]
MRKKQAGDSVEMGTGPAMRFGITMQRTIGQFTELGRCPKKRGSATTLGRLRELGAGCILILVAALPRGMAEDIIVIRPPSWHAAIERWAEYRSAQGYSIAYVDASHSAEAARQQILELVQRRGQPAFIVIMGDAAPTVPDGPYQPTFYRPSTALVQFGGDRTIATDVPFADFDGDEIPDAAVGRIVADSAEELQAYLDRVLAFESSPDFSPWRRDVHVVAGVGGFGMVADTVIETTTRQFLAHRIPGWCRLTMTHASPSSKYCPNPERFCQCSLDSLNAGGAFWVYIGHGHVRTLDWIRAGQRVLPILTKEHLAEVDCPRPPIAVFLACYTGAFDATEDALAERLVLQPGGTIAAIAATRVSGPYGLAVLSDGLLRAVYEKRLPTLGQIVLDAKRAMLDEGGAQEEPPSDRLRWISAIAAAMSPEGYDLRAERQEHVWQMHLLGDPLLRLRFPDEIRLETSGRAEPGKIVQVRGTVPAGTMTLELAYRRSDVRRDLDSIAVDWDSYPTWEQYQERYLRANQPVLVRDQWQCSAGAFERDLVVPPDLAQGKYCIRAYVEGADGFHVGYAEVSVRPAAEATE